MELNKLAGSIIILQSVGILCTANRELGCPKDWKRFDNSCYKSPSTPSNWFAAQINCSNYNAHLVTVSSERENAFLIREIITKQLQSRHFWIGLQRAPFDINNWLWVDGTRLTFSDWYSGQPDNYRQEEFCGEMYVLQVRYGVVKWNDVNCSRASSFICEKELIDLRSCSKDNGGCQHLCVSTIGRPVCKMQRWLYPEKDGTVCLDPKMTMPMPEARPAQTADSFAVALLIIQLLSLTLLIPMSCVLVSFLQKSFQSKRRRSSNKSRTVVINPPPSNDEHSFRQSNLSAYLYNV
ncbi:hypothetical protein OS493_036755 [Desmophyllum pertusum]|uniref:C-type lectin domain-containing protein n=1 Tax=Desmophyllum pertusum TaxID=174260 RepID=A0A9W9Z9U7_9CNID|nr:hypothetical protein OS493_036755 [Desmophyllum pertusum]